MTNQCEGDVIGLVHLEMADALLESAQIIMDTVLPEEKRCMPMAGWASGGDDSSCEVPLTLSPPPDPPERIDDDPPLEPLESETAEVLAHRRPRRDARYLRELIVHFGRAANISRQILRTTERPDIRELAGHVVRAQEAQIELARRMLEREQRPAVVKEAVCKFCPQ